MPYALVGYHAKEMNEKLSGLQNMGKGSHISSGLTDHLSSCIIIIRFAQQPKCFGLQLFELAPFEATQSRLVVRCFLNYIVYTRTPSDVRIGPKTPSK